MYLDSFLPSEKIIIMGYTWILISKRWNRKGRGDTVEVKFSPVKSNQSSDFEERRDFTALLALFSTFRMDLFLSLRPSNCILSFGSINDSATISFNFLMQASLLFPWVLHMKNWQSEETSNKLSIDKINRQNRPLVK